MSEEGEAIKVVTRQVLPDDKNLIMQTWLKGNYYGTHFGNMPSALYYQEYADHIKRILFDPEVQVTVACADTHSDFIVGFSVYKRNTLYWIYVKRDYRRKGIARLLLKGQNISVVKALTYLGRVIADRKGLAYNPL